MVSLEIRLRRKGGLRMGAAAQPGALFQKGRVLPRYRAGTASPLRAEHPLKVGCRPQSGRFLPLDIYTTLLYKLCYKWYMSFNRYSGSVTKPGAQAAPRSRPPWRGVFSLTGAGTVRFIA